MDQRIYPHPFIAKEGWPFIAGTGILALIVTALDWDFLSLALWILFVIVLQFFRDPAREIPQGEKLVLSVVDGRVLKVEKAVNPYTGKESLLISVFMNLFNVHSQKSPVAGTVEQKVYRPGKYFNASLDKASAENEQCAVVLRTKDGNQLTFVQIAGLVTHRILNYVKAGDVLKAGDRYGFIRFGSRVDMYLPLTAQPKVVIGEKVWGTTTVLAILGDPEPEEKEPVVSPEKTEGAEAAVAASEAPAAEEKASEAVAPVEKAAEAVSVSAPEAQETASASVAAEAAEPVKAVEPAPASESAPAPEEKPADVALPKDGAKAA